METWITTNIIGETDRTYRAKWDDALALAEYLGIEDAGVSVRVWDGSQSTDRTAEAAIEVALEKRSLDEVHANAWLHRVLTNDSDAEKQVENHFHDEEEDAREFARQVTGDYYASVL